MKSSIITRTLLGYSLILALFTAISIYQARRFQQVQSAFKQLNENYIPLSKLLNQVEGLIGTLPENAPHQSSGALPRIVREKLVKASRLSQRAAEAVQGDLRQHLERTRERLDRILVQLQNPPGDSALPRYSRPNTAVKILARQLDRQVQVAMLNLEQEQYRSTLIITLLMAGAIVLSLAVTIFTAVFILRPIRTLTDAVRRIGRGEFHARIPVRGGQEIETLAREFNQMSGALSEREAALQRQHQDLLRAEKLAAVGKMAAQITHEVRNPLNSIGLNLELLHDELDENASTAALERLQAIEREVARLQEISQTYLDLARDRQPKLHIQDLDQLIRDVYTLVKERGAQQGIRIELDLIPQLPHVDVDQTQIKQALWNLLVNAIDATPAGGSVRLATSSSDEAVSISISDTGPGIPESRRDRLFTPFFSTKPQGSGLGLAITSKIINDHGGSIDLQSRSGEGSTFTVHLPRNGARA